MAGDKVVITTFKNEAPYILEWVAHYKTLGFDKLVVYTNDCTDGTNRILKRLEELGDVVFHINQVGTGGIHRSALRQARRLDVVKNAEWVLVCDIDEFLNIHIGNHTVDDLIAASAGDVDAIAIPWKLFSNNGRSILRDSLVTSQFTDAEVAPVDGGATRRFVKTIFRPSEMILRVGLHGPILREDAVGSYTWAVPGGGQKTRTGISGHVRPPFGYEVAQLNHYAVRSVESYLLKRHRGRANHMSDVLDTEYWDRWNRGGEEDTSILRYLPEVQRRLAAYKQDDGLRRLHKQGFKWHKTLVAELKSEPDYIALKRKCDARLTRTAPAKERPLAPPRPATPLGDVISKVRTATRPSIGALWIGTALSYLEQMCLLSFVRHGHSVTLFTGGSVSGVPPEVTVADMREIYETAALPHSQAGSPPLQSDVFRLAMISQTGLVWAETDMLSLRPIADREGHVHGLQSDMSVSTAILGLPGSSPALARCLDYIADPYPVPPWWDAERQDTALALKGKGQWKHASQQSPDVYGAQAIDHFLRISGEIGKSAPPQTYHPVAANDVDLLVEPSGIGAADITEDTRAVHLWAGRLRQCLRELGLQKGGLVYETLRELDINPQSAPL
ncbi:MAG: glycosyltransferase family 2 protein [Pseudomonadota bacterium]